MTVSANRAFYEDIDSVAGWLEPAAGYLTSLLVAEQNAAGFRGDFCEIGVYKGRYFLTVATLLNHEERALAVDIFDDQSMSHDTQGYAELGVPLANLRNDFERNIGRFLPPEQIEIIARPSTDLSSTDLGGPFRFFSIDGGHSHDVVLHDLKLADATTSSEGIVSIDDLFNVQWPGVISAFFEFLPKSDLVPLALIPNKLLCCRPAMVERYRSALRAAAPSAIWRRDVDLARHRVDLFRNGMTTDDYFQALKSRVEVQSGVAVG